MANEDQINLDLLAENARQRERINVLEARYAREQGVVSGLRESIATLKEVAQALGVKGADYLDEWSRAALQRDRLISAGTELECIVVALNSGDVEVSHDTIEVARAKWEEAIKG